MSPTDWWFNNLKILIHTVGLAMVSHPIDWFSRHNVLLQESTPSTKEPENDIREAGRKRLGSQAEIVEI